MPYPEALGDSHDIDVAIDVDRVGREGGDPP